MAKNEKSSHWWGSNPHTLQFQSRKRTLNISGKKIMEHIQSGLFFYIVNFTNPSLLQIMSLDIGHQSLPIIIGPYICACINDIQILSYLNESQKCVSLNWGVDERKKNFNCHLCNQKISVKQNLRKHSSEKLWSQISHLNDFLELWTEAVCFVKLPF